MQVQTSQGGAAGGEEDSILQRFPLLNLQVQRLYLRSWARTTGGRVQEDRFVDMREHNFLMCTMEPDLLLNRAY